MPKLKNKRYEEFCQQYILDFNGARAAVAPGCSQKAAKVTACKWLKRPEIQERIVELLQERSKRTQITQDMVLQELAVLGFSDFNDYGRIKEDGSVEFDSFDKMKKGKTHAVKSIKETVSQSGRSISLRLHEKVEPLKLIGKHLGMFAEKNEFKEVVQYLLSEKFMPKAEKKK